MHSLVNLFNTKLESLPNEKYKVNFVKEFLIKSHAIKTLQFEMNNVLNFKAWNEQIFHFRQIKDSFLKRQSDESIDQVLFYVEDAIDQLFEELENQADDDEAYVSEEENDDKNTLWKDIVRTMYIDMAKQAVDFIFVEKTIAVLLDYTASVRDANNEPPSEAQLNFTQEDKQLKQALLNYRVSNQLKQKAYFLEAELHSISKELLNGANKNIELVKHVIKYGYPIPLTKASMIADIFDRFLIKSNIYGAGIELTIEDDQKNIVLKKKIKDGKAKLILKHFNGSVFLCQADHRASIGMSSDKPSEEYNAYFYEAFVSKMSFLKEKFPKKAETLRDGLLKEISIDTV